MLKELVSTFLIAITIWATSVGNSLLNKISILESRVEETEQDLGGINFVAGKVYKLSGSGISGTATTVSLTSFQKPITDEELAMTDFGDIGYGTFDPGTTEKKEFMSFTGVTQDGSSDKATLTGVTRGLQFTTPYTASSTLAVSHSGGAKFIISNAPQLYNEMAIKRNDEDILGQWTFDADDIADYDAGPTFTTDNQIITKKYADDLAIAGVPDGNLTTKGIFEMATLAELLAGTATGTTGAYLTAPTSLFATTTSASNLVTVTDTDGLLDEGFIPVLTNQTIAQPTGAITAYASSTAPTGWLLCDGSAISRTTYSALFAITGTTFGVGNGSTTFNKPNLKGKNILGYGSATTTFDVMGETGGEDTHLLTDDESGLPNHRHGSMPSGTDILSGDTGETVTTEASVGYTGYEGGDNASTTHNILDPFIVLNYIIKY